MPSRREVNGEPVGYALICRGFEVAYGQAPAVARRSLRAEGSTAERRGSLAYGRSCPPRARPRLRGGLLELWRPNAAGRAFYQRLAAEEAGDFAVMCLDGERLSAMEQLPGTGNQPR